MRKTPTLLLLLLLTACAVNPVTGRRQLMFLTSSDEIALGRNADRDIVAAYGSYEDAPLAEYVGSIGQEMAVISHRPELEYTFRVLDTPVINAFALPGGYIYVTRGILAHMGSEAELAGVVGHEIGHITARHSAQRYSQAYLAQLGLGVGAAVSEKFRRYAGIAQAGVGLLLLRFSRDDERQADDLGVQYATAVGYDAAEMANFFETLESMNPGGGQGLPGWFSTHPSPTERVQTIRRRTQREQEKDAAGSYAVDRAAFLERIDGLIYGPDPRQGYVREGVFYHPVLAFRYPLPPEWAFENLPSQVQITDPDENAIMLFRLGERASAAEEAEAFTSEIEGTLQESTRVRVSGLDARRTLVRAESGENTLVILSYFIGMGERVYAFHGATTPGRLSAYRDVFETTMTGFAPLTDPAYLEVEPDRLRIREALAGGTLRENLLALGMPEDRLEELSYLNGRSLDEAVAAGEKVKIIELNAPPGR